MSSNQESLEKETNFFLPHRNALVFDSSSEKSLHTEETTMNDFQTGSDVSTNSDISEENSPNSSNLNQVGCN